MGKFIDLTGMKFGRWTVESRAENNKRGQAMWHCRCDCGNIGVVSGVSLRSGHSKSCGCLQKEATSISGKNNAEDLSGKRFGFLTVLERTDNPHGKKYGPVYWKCICDCGNETIVSAPNLKLGHSKSCGCLAKKLSSERVRTHGMTGTRIYNIWHSMKQRCSMPNHISYKNYGAIGIAVCDEWENSFESFYEWSMCNGYSDELTLDRIDSSKGYSPDNCRWTTLHVQNNNRRSNHYITHNGETHSMKDWSRILGIKYDTIQARIRYGWSEDELLLPPSKKKRHFKKGTVR